MVRLDTFAALVDDVVKAHGAVTSAALGIKGSTDGFLAMAEAIRAEGAAIVALQDALPMAAPEQPDPDERREKWREARELGL